MIHGLCAGHFLDDFPNKSPVRGVFLLQLMTQEGTIFYIPILSPFTTIFVSYITILFDDTGRHSMFSKIVFLFRVLQPKVIRARKDTLIAQFWLLLISMSISGTDSIGGI